MNNLRFADHTILCAKCKKKLAELQSRVEEEIVKYGLTLNKNKTKVLIVDKANILPMSKWTNSSTLDQ